MNEIISEIDKKRKCPNCSGDILMTGYKDSDSWINGVCTECQIVTHSSKGCQLQNCEWHVICGKCDSEICGDYREVNSIPRCQECIDKVTKLTAKEVVEIEDLKHHFESQVEYVQTILENKDSLDYVIDSEIDYVVRDKINYNSVFETLKKIQNRNWELE